MKLCDFGWSAENLPYENRVTFCGTLEYMSPEILRGEPQDFNVDIWALGILLYEMFHKRPPYSGRTPSEMMKSINQTNVCFEKNVPHEARDLILRILRKDQTKR
jgi:serine/threonine protein kinase